MVMKTKTYDWLLRYVYIDSLGNRTIEHVSFYDMTKAQIMEVAEDYSKNSACVRVYKLDVVL